MRAQNILILLLALQFGTTVAEAAPELPSVKLGFITDLSGIGSSWGSQARIGAEIARDEINAANGRLEVVFGDHTFKPTTALSESQKMLDFDNVDALWVEFAPTAVASSAPAAKKHRLFLNNSAATSILEHNPYAFKAYLDYERGCREIGEAWKRQGVTKAGMIKLNAEFAELCLKGAKAVYPDLTVTSYDFSEDVSTQVLRLKSEGSQAIFNVGLEADMLNMLKVCRNLNYHPKIAVAEPDSLTPLVIKTSPDMLEGVTSFGFPPVDSAFLDKLSKRLGSKDIKTPEAAAIAYTHVRQIYAAISKCPNREIGCITASMAASGPDSTMRFRAWKNRTADYDFSLKQWKEGKLVNLKMNG
jgi:branched-chain amino acid transport system substrate-binding protein